jgi:flagellar basal-body rod protein FlgF
MQRGLYIAATGMLAEQVRQDQIANDLANASTAGYKADRSMQRSFDSLLLQFTGTGQFVGPLTLGAGIADIRTDLSQAPLRQTGQPLDVALNGDGFIAVATADGVRYTRNGQLSVDSAGRLLTGGGLTVLGTDGRPIVVGATDDIQIAGDGSVTAGNRRVGTIAVVGLDGATKAGEGLFVGTPIAKPADTTLEQGFVEGSGVDPTRSMVDMIVSLRAFEASQRVIHAIDETLGKAVNQVGSPTGQ